MKFFGKKLMLVFLVPIGLVSDLRSVDPVCGIFGGLSNESDCEILYAVLGGSTALGLIGFALWKYFQSSSFNATDLYQAAVNAVKALPDGYTPDQAQQAVITAAEQYLLQSQSTSKGSATITPEQLTQYLNDNYPNPAGSDPLSKTLTQLQNLSNDFVINTPQTQIGTSTNWADYLPSSAIDIAPGVFFVSNGIPIATYKSLYSQSPGVTPDQMFDFVIQWKTGNDLVSNSAAFKDLYRILQTPIRELGLQDCILPKAYSSILDYLIKNKIYTANDFVGLLDSAMQNSKLLPVGSASSSDSKTNSGSSSNSSNNNSDQPSTGDLGDFDSVLQATTYYQEHLGDTQAEWSGFYKTLTSQQEITAMARDLVAIDTALERASQNDEDIGGDEIDYGLAEAAFQDSYGFTPEAYLAAYA